MSEENIDNLSEKEVRYESMFLSILQNEGKIEPLIDHFFKFLYRRTDFYLTQEKPGQSYGFPAGFSKQLIMKAFQKYDNYSKENLKKKLMESTDSKIMKSEEPKKIRPNENLKEMKKIQEINKEFINSTPESTKEKLKKQQEVFQNNPASYNGAMRENYSWAQTIKEIDIQVHLDPRIKSSKDVKVKIEKQFLHVSIKEENNSWKNIVNEKLAWIIKPDESTWSLFPSDHIHINLEKTMERWWENLLINEEKIDLQNMNPEKPMEDLDVESQAKLKQMMFDEHQKKLGLPTSEENKTNEILRKAWNAEGSPFKGQPFDPSLVTTSNPNIGTNY